VSPARRRWLEKLPWLVLDFIRQSPNLPFATAGQAAELPGQAAELPGQADGPAPLSP
jgi:hypothetical protein